MHEGKWVTRNEQEPITKGPAVQGEEYGFDSKHIGELSKGWQDLMYDFKRQL